MVCWWERWTSGSYRYKGYPHPFQVSFLQTSLVLTHTKNGRILRKSPSWCRTGRGGNSSWDTHPISLTERKLNLLGGQQTLLPLGHWWKFPAGEGKEEGKKPLLSLVEGQQRYSVYQRLRLYSNIEYSYPNPYQANRHRIKTISQGQQEGWTGRVQRSFKEMKILCMIV